MAYRTVSLQIDKGSFNSDTEPGRVLNVKVSVDTSKIALVDNVMFSYLLDRFIPGLVEETLLSKGSGVVLEFEEQYMKEIR